MKEIVYRCDECQMVLENIAVGAVVSGNCVKSFVVVESIFETVTPDPPNTLFCDWTCHMKYMNGKFPMTNGG